MIVSVNCSDIKEYANKLKNVDFPSVMTKSLDKSCEKILSNLRPATPVITGLLRKSWHVKSIWSTIGGAEAVIENDATKTNLKSGTKTTYPSFVNYGFTMRNGRWRNGQFFMEQGIKDSNVEEMVRKDLLKALEEKM